MFLTKKTESQILSIKVASQRTVLRYEIILNMEHIIG